MSDPTADLNTELLPPLLQRWAQAIGLPLTLKLVQEYGGFRLYIPKRITAEHALAQLLGLDAAQALIKSHGSEPNVLVPKAQRALLAVRDAKIMREYGPKTAVQLAREHGLSEPAIWRVVERHSAQRTQAIAQAASQAQAQLW